MRYCAILYHNNCTMADFVHFLPKTVSYEFFYISNKYQSSFCVQFRKNLIISSWIRTSDPIYRTYSKKKKERKKNRACSGFELTLLWLLGRRLNPFGHSDHILQKRYFYVHKPTTPLNLAPAGRGHFELLRSPGNRNRYSSFSWPLF